MMHRGGRTELRTEEEIELENVKDVGSDSEVFLGKSMSQSTGQGQMEEIGWYGQWKCPVQALWSLLFSEPFKTQLT